MQTIINDEMGRIWTEKAVVCVQVSLQHLHGRPDKNTKETFQNRFLRFLRMVFQLCLLDPE